MLHLGKLFYQFVFYGFINNTSYSGATPFATVSSRISQHFKRAAEHNPPRAPLLAKHVDQNHSRKINYSLATESVDGSAAETHDVKNKTAAKEEEYEEEEEELERYRQDPSRTNSKTRRHPTSNSDSDSEDSDHGRVKKHKSRHLVNKSPPPRLTSDDDDSEGEHSDYHEEMLKGDVDIDLHVQSGRRLSRRQSVVLRPTNDNKSPSKKPNKSSNNTIHNVTIPHTPIHTSTSNNQEKPKEPLKDQDKPIVPTITTPSNTSKEVASSTAIRKPSFSFSSGFPGDQELWTPFSFEHDFDNVFLQEPSTAHHIPFNIATPESVSVSELDNYFANTSTSSNTSKRKSFSSTMLGPNDKSLLQKVLLASAARGVADKIEEEEEPPQPPVKQEAVVESPPAPPVKSTLVNSSSLMDVDNGEDFVKFEDDEKKEPTITTIASVAPINTTPKPPTKKVADILPATPTTLTAAEILKSMNIQNLNLSALHQMTSNIPSLQHLSPTFDLAKTMAAYMQSLAKSANASASNSNSPHAMDLKSILARFPALEAFIKKDPTTIATSSSAASSSGIATPPLLSPTATTQSPDFVPNLINGTPSSSLTAGSTEPIVHTLSPQNPPMYITLIDHIAVCIVVLAKTEQTPEYRLMRRVDTGFINGTTLLTAGGIETESERSMILSFEMERVRMPKKKSALFGTWIPLRRAQELAVTCSLQHKLGHFLEDSIEPYFPSPLPIHNTRKPARDSRLTALALAALRSSASSSASASDSKGSGFVMPPISRQSSSSGSMAAAQLQELLLTHPHKALKSNGLKAPLLSQETTATPASIQPSKGLSSTSSAKKATGLSEKEESDVDIVNSSDSSVASSNDDEESDHEEAKKKTPPTTLNLEEILNRVTSKQPLHIHPRDLQKKRRLHEAAIGEESLVEQAAKTSKAAASRKKPANTGGKWSNNTKSTTNSVAIKKSPSGASTITIKRPATTTPPASTTSSNNKKGQGKVISSKKKEDIKTEPEIGNVVVEHKTVKVEPKNDPPPQQKVEQDDEEDDEDIDIGGSDFDDDLR
jgi:hypothetical protein